LVSVNLYEFILAAVLRSAALVYITSKQTVVVVLKNSFRN